MKKLYYPLFIIIISIYNLYLKSLLPSIIYENILIILLLYKIYKKNNENKLNDEKYIEILKYQIGELNKIIIENKKIRWHYKNHKSFNDRLI